MKYNIEKSCLLDEEPTISQSKVDALAIFVSMLVGIVAKGLWDNINQIGTVTKESFL